MDTINEKKEKKQLMERLTFEGNFCDISMCMETPYGSCCESGSCSQRKVWERLKAYEETGLTPEEFLKSVAHIMELHAAFRNVFPVAPVHALAKAAKEGRLVVLPCKMGDYVFGIRLYNKGGNRVKEGIVQNMHYGDDMRLCIAVKNVCTGEWGRNIFATREEAEKALEGGLPNDQ